MGGFIALLRGFGSGFAERIPKRRVRYWLTALTVFVIALWTAPFIDGRLEMTRERSWLFQHLSRATTNPTQPRNVKLLLIGDDEFWDGALHHRTPIDKSYVAQLVRRLNDAEASVIALDFDVRLADPHTRAQPGDYGAVNSYEPYTLETDNLIRAIDDVAQQRKIVLSKTILGPIGGPFTFGSDIYQPYGICVGLGADGRWANPGTKEFPLTAVARQNISCGYIALMPDKREVPPPVVIRGESARLDSFPLAIVRARDPGAAPALASRPYYASYISQDVALNPRTTVSAHDLIVDPQKAKTVLQGWPVIVGEAWNQRGKGSGGLVDMHETPIGPVVGALVHENMAEAMLSNRIFPGLGSHWPLILEVVAGAVAAVVFSAFAGLWMRVLAVLASIVLLFFVQWLTLQLFGVFFDAFIPVLGLGLHAIIDRLIGH